MVRHALAFLVGGWALWLQCQAAPSYGRILQSDGGASSDAAGAGVSDDDRDFTLRAVILFVSITLILIGVAAFAGSKSDSPLARGAPLIMLNLIDFITDCVFVGSVRDDEQIFVPALTFIVLPSLINIIFVVAYLVNKIFKEAERGETQVTEWLMNNSTIAGFVALLALSRLDIIKYLPPLPDRDRARIAAAGLAPLFLEDVPQVVLQGLALGKATDALQLSLAAIAIVYGILTILAGCFGRFFTACAFYVERQERIKARRGRNGVATSKSPQADSTVGSSPGNGLQQPLNLQVKVNPRAAGRPPKLDELSPSSSASLSKVFDVLRSKRAQATDPASAGRRV